MVLVGVFSKPVDYGEGYGNEGEAEHEQGTALPGELPKRQREDGYAHRFTR